LERRSYIRQYYDGCTATCDRHDIAFGSVKSLKRR